MMKIITTVFNTMTKIAKGLITVQDSLLVICSIEDSQNKKELLKEYT